LLEDRITRVKKLIEQRDEIDKELSQLLGVEPKARRGRPPNKENGSGEAPKVVEA
jgi:hypothetical protein